MARPKGNQEATMARREAMLDAALEVFGANGYNGSSLKQVAEIVGVTEAGILHHFGTKSKLLLEVLSRRDQATSRWIYDAGSLGVDFVVGWLNTVEYNINHPGIVELFAILSAESTTKTHPAHQYFRERYATSLAITETRFAQLRAEKALTVSSSPKQLSQELFALSDGFQIQWLLDPAFDMMGSHERYWQRILIESTWLEVESARLATKPELLAQIALIGA